jgi:hypothetical protein
MQSTLSGSKQVGLFPCRGSVAPCRTLSLVSATSSLLSNRGFPDPGKARIHYALSRKPSFISDFRLDDLEESQIRKSYRKPARI